MPSGKNWTNFVFINLGFIIYIVIVFYYSQLNEIKKNWPKYRCNPTYMFLADDIQENFIYCVQNVQTNFIGHLLQPLEYVTSSISGLMGGFVTEINSVRGMINKMRTFSSGNTKNIFGIFVNVIVQFQKITIGIKDTFGKLLGILVTIINVVNSLLLTFQSGWNGPPGQMVRTLGSCFDPETPVKLKNGTIKTMKNLDLGDILENGSIVEAVMKIDNKRNVEPLYIIKGEGVNNGDIYVTGSHLVLNSKTNKFCKVENYFKSKLSNKNVDWFSCLITSDHKIQIGKEVFLVWEDHFVKANLQM
jgi:hypothetical protein